MVLRGVQHPCYMIFWSDDKDPHSAILILKNLWVGFVTLTPNPQNKKTRVLNWSQKNWCFFADLLVGGDFHRSRDWNSGQIIAISNDWKPPKWWWKVREIPWFQENREGWWNMIPFGQILVRFLYDFVLSWSGLQSRGPLYRQWGQRCQLKKREEM